MKVKRTCRFCGHVWFGSVAGGVAGRVLKEGIATLLTALTKGTYIDYSKSVDDLRKCPNCGASASYKTELIKE